MAGKAALVNDAKQGALDVSTTALAIFDYIEKHGMDAMARPFFITLITANQEARTRLFDALKEVGYYNLGRRV